MHAPECEPMRGGSSVTGPSIGRLFPSLNLRLSKKGTKMGLPRWGHLPLIALVIVRTQRDGLETRTVTARLSGSRGTVLVERR